MFIFIHLFDVGNSNISHRKATVVVIESGSGWRRRRRQLWLFSQRKNTHSTCMLVICWNFWRKQIFKILSVSFYEINTIFTCLLEMCLSKRIFFLWIWSGQYLLRAFARGMRVVSNTEPRYNRIILKTTSSSHHWRSRVEGDEIPWQLGSKKWLENCYGSLVSVSELQTTRFTCQSLPCIVNEATNQRAAHERKVKNNCQCSIGCNSLRTDRRTGLTSSYFADSACYCHLAADGIWQSLAMSYVIRTAENLVGSQEPLLATVKIRKLVWFGHVTKHDSLSKTMMHGTVEGGRRRGRHRKN